jgi:predicted metal-dependent phosphotriesterase family hydrolase
MTVLGPIGAEEAAITLSHEYAFVDLTRHGLRLDDVESAVTPSARGRTPISLPQLAREAGLERATGAEGLTDADTETILADNPRRAPALRRADRERRDGTRR